MSKIFGVNPGMVDPELINQASEYEIFLAIYAYKAQVEKWESMEVPGILHMPQLPEYQYTLDYLKQSTTRFGVEMLEPEEGRRVVETESFQKWFNFYKNHYESLSDNQRDIINALRMAGEDFSEYLPEGNWQDATERKMTPSDKQDNQE